MQKTNEMTKTSPLTVVSYVPKKGAIVQIPFEAIPTPFQSGSSFQADIDIVQNEISTSYKLIFEFKKKSVSATNVTSPPFALGLILGMSTGPHEFEEYSVSNVSKNTHDIDFISVSEQSEQS